MALADEFGQRARTHARSEWSADRQRFLRGIIERALAEKHRLVTHAATFYASRARPAASERWGVKEPSAKQSRQWIASIWTMRRRPPCGKKRSMRCCLF